MSSPEPDWYYPEVPSVPQRDRVDLGPAGSLIEARRRLKTARRAARPAAHRSVTALGGFALSLVSLALIVVCVIVLASDQSWAAKAPRFGFAATVAVVCAAGASVLLMRWTGTGRAGELLDRMISYERKLAPLLDELTAYGWTVLPDRLVPGGEARVPFILVGPAGIVVPTPVPALGSWTLAGDVVRLNDRNMGSWVGTRWWEAETIHNAVAEASAGMYEGPTYPLIAVPDGPADKRNHPAMINRIPIVRYEHVISSVLDFPAPLPRETAMQLAITVEEVCPPAGIRQ